MPSSHSQDSSKSLPSFKDSGSPSTNKNNKYKSSNDNDNKNKSNKKKNNDVKASSPALPRSMISSSHFALYPPWNSWNSSSSTEKNGSNRYNINNVIITGADIGAILLLLLMIACMLYCCHMKKRKQRNDNNRNIIPSEIMVDTNNGYYSTQHAGNQHQERGDLHIKMPPQPLNGSATSDQQPLAMVGGNEKNVFTYDELLAATKGFDSSLLLGQGIFGYVHKGVLPNGKEVAVKSLKLGSGQGDGEFQAEVEILSSIHHQHLVSLVGYCIAEQQRILVYEFIPNRTLEYHLHGEGCPVMDWSTRFKLALGAAKGFAYLHEDCNPRIVHRNIKAANILLDDHYEAKVVDFGLTKLSSETITHVSTRVMGTFGYLAPEYASMGKLTEKSDVYSYGVVLLELITGRRPINRNSNEENLIDWARPILMHASDGGNLEKIVDPRIVENYNPDKMLRMVACAAACIRHSPRIRPKMSQIVRILDGKSPRAT